MSAPTQKPRIELAPWQFECGGIVLGHGTPIPVGNIEGLGSPTVRAQDVDNPVGDGTFPGQDFYGPRTVRIEAGIKTPGDPAKAADLLARLQRALDDPAARTEPEGRAVLRGRWPGHEVRRLYGRLRRMEATSTATAVHGWIPLDIEFAALDPRWHADEASHLQLSLDQAPVRRSVTAPLGAPARCGSADPAQRPGWITNHGYTSAWPTLRIHGPVARPRIWNTVTGRVLELTTTLRDAEWIEIQTRPGTCWALRNGTVNAAGDLTPFSRIDLFTIPPGRSEIGWSGEDPTRTCRLEVSWRSAYTAL
ncbi:phage tail domain-containing protein [Streptantibioticus ferralitis]|uniref:Phage tail family protein n=1 Tax=Streptantibioticus ferralitis TaxID=236510 RepID=A0ABT5Z0H4_9ACTN|nr:phage tail domain-containing protein [Streptantibioticus ferralitis]MDF2257177.1 phage tail family protein [Streptantibioticus ferralitis]